MKEDDETKKKYNTHSTVLDPKLTAQISQFISISIIYCSLSVL